MNVMNRSEAVRVMSSFEKLRCNFLQECVCVKPWKWTSKAMIVVPVKPRYCCEKYQGRVFHAPV